MTAFLSEIMGKKRTPNQPISGVNYLDFGDLSRFDAVKIQNREPLSGEIYDPETDETIDEVLKRGKEEETDEFMVEADEKSIIDKVLKQKIKSKK